MTELEKKLNRISQLAEKVVKENLRLKAQVEGLEHENSQLKNSLKEKEITEENLLEKIKILKLRNTLTQKGDSAEVKLRINQLVRDIDKSIELLTKM